MRSFSPTAEGFRLIFRRPSIPLAEIAWRWSFAAAAWFLGVMFLFEYADSLPVTRLDRLLLATQQPVLVLRAIRRIFEGSAFRFTRAGVLMTLALVVAWIVLASVGRAVTMRSLTEELELGAAVPWSRKTVRSLVAINFLRAAVMLAAVTAGIGSLLLASSMWASTHATAGDAARLWLALLFITGAAWSALNWLLSTSAIFAGDNRSAFEAVASAVRFCGKRPVALVASGTWFGLAHFGAFLLACGAGFSVLGLAGVIGGGPVLFLEFLILLVYSAVADFLYIARLAAHVAIIRGGDQLVSVGTGIIPPGLPSESGTVDRTELILIDVPLPAI